MNNDGLIKELRETASKGVSAWGDLQMAAAAALEAAQHFDAHAVSTRHHITENKDYIRGYCAGCEEGYIKAKTAYEQPAPQPECKACTELRNIADHKKLCQEIRMQELPSDMRKAMQANINELYDEK